MNIRKKIKFDRNSKNLIIGIVAGIIGLFLLIAAISGVNNVKYDGLGESREYPASQIDMSKFYQDKNNFRVYRSGLTKGIPGVDVSEHQGTIDWEKARNAGVQFAMVRLGYRTSSSGEIHIDSMFEANMEGLKKANIPKGVYFFSQATTPEEAIEEAHYVVKNIKNKGINMPVAYDMEPVNLESDRISEMSVEQKTEVADAFCKYIKKSGYEPLIYGNPTWIYNHLDLSRLTDYDIWLAHYNGSTDFPYKFKMWQYNEQGLVDGIPGNVDLDIYFK